MLLRKAFLLLAIARLSSFCCAQAMDAPAAEPSKKRFDDWISQEIRNSELRLRMIADPQQVTRELMAANQQLPTVTSLLRIKKMEKRPTQSISPVPPAHNESVPVMGPPVCAEDNTYFHLLPRDLRVKLLTYKNSLPFFLASASANINEAIQKIKEVNHPNSPFAGFLNNEALYICMAEQLKRKFREAWDESYTAKDSWRKHDIISITFALGDPLPWKWLRDQFQTTNFNRLAIVRQFRSAVYAMDKSLAKPFVDHSPYY